MGSYGLSDEVRVLRERMRKFIDGEVVPAEADLEKEEHEPTARRDGTMARLKARGEGSRDSGRSVIPVEIGGQGIPFMSLRVPERDHRPLALGTGRGRIAVDAGLDHAAPLRHAPSRRSAGSSRSSRATSIRRSG